MTRTQRSFPDWNLLYKSEKVVNMPWYNENLDFDLEEEITQRKIATDRFLDLGTGPGTQAIHLSKLGFVVTASDLSISAYE